MTEAPPDAWRALVEGDPNATPAHRPEVWTALAQALPGLRARFIAVERGGALIGGAPVMVERRAGFQWLHALPYLLPAAPLAREGAHSEVDAAVAGALRALQAEVGAVGGEWALYRPRGPAVAAAALARVPGETRVLEAALLDVSAGIDLTTSRMDRKTRKEIRRARALGGLQFAEAPAALAECYALHRAQARAWAGYRPMPLELSRRLLACAPASGLPIARLFTVRDGRGLLAGALALDHPAETLLWWSGTHPAARPRHAFAFLLWSVAEWAAAAGRRRLNLGASAGRSTVSAFKDALGARPADYPVRWLDDAFAPPLGRLIAAAQARLRRGRDRGRAA